MRGQGSGGTRDSQTWYKVKKDENNALSNIIALRVSPFAAFALDGSGNLWTWGERVFLADNTDNTTESFATQMTLPGETGSSIKMIGTTGQATYSGNGSLNLTIYYVLYGNNHLYSLGDGDRNGLGNWSTDDAKEWVRPKYTNGAGSEMNDIRWISASDHDFGYAFINVINDAGVLWNWGNESGSHLGRSTTGNGASTTSSVGMNPGISYNEDKVLAVESGGHTTMISVQCKDKFGYVGHKVRGSMGDGTNNEGSQASWTFSTAYVQACGVTTVPVIDVQGEPAQSEGKLCNNQTILSSGTPSGGTFSVSSGDGTLANGNQLTYTGTGDGSVTIKYDLTGATECDPPYVEKTFQFTICANPVVSGRIWIDSNGDAVYNGTEQGTSGATAGNGGLWANLVDATGKVVGSVAVKPDGTYDIPVTSGNGNYTVVITQNQVGVGTNISNGNTNLPGNWEYTGNNNDGTPCVVPACTNPYSIPVTVSGGDVENIDFGINTKASTISGSVFNDADGLEDGSVDGNKIQKAGDEPLYVAVVDANGKVYDYVAVDENGNYEFNNVPWSNAFLVLTSTLPVIGNTVQQTLPSGWTNAGEDFGAGNTKGSGANDGSGTGSNAPNTKYDGRIAVGITPGSNASSINFGIDRVPVADNKLYEVGSDVFTNAKPQEGFPIVPGYQGIPMASGDLKLSGNPGVNGSLSGSDAEDCVAAGSCNGNTGGTGATFTIETINANTKLYYDFGLGNGGVMEITPGMSIPNFDVTKMVIYGELGSGTTGDEIGFTYTMTDAAGVKSSPATYQIRTNAPLPINLLSFEAAKRGNVSDLHWTTSSETNNKGFEVLRSTDGRNWKTIGFVNSLSTNGTSINRLDYNFTDNTPVKGNNYYRLKQTDLNGQFNYSKIRMVNFTDGGKIEIYPNPFSNKINIAGLNGREIIVVYDFTGREVSRFVAGQSNVELALDKLNTGAYNLVIIGDDGSWSVNRVIKVD